MPDPQTDAPETPVADETQPLVEADLTAKTRDALPDSAFAAPGRRLPIHDAHHARLAWSQVDRTEGLSAEEKAEAKKRIKAACYRFGVVLDEDNDTDGPGDTDMKESTTLAAETAPEAPPAPTGPIEEPSPQPEPVQAPAPDLITTSGRASMASLHEAHPMTGATVDRRHRDVEVRIISPGFGASKANGLPVYYPATALEKAAPHFSGRKCFLNHPTAHERATRPERDIKDWAATLRESWWDSTAQEARGVMRTYDPWLMARVEAAPDEVALSLNAAGPTKAGTVNGTKAAIVESIERIDSVDIVTYAGARGGVVRLIEGETSPRDDTPVVPFTESEQHEVDRDMLDTMSAEDIRKARPDLFPEVDHTAQLTEALAPYAERVSQLERELNMRDTRVMVDTVLAACDLPEKATERVRAQFAESTCGYDDSSTFAHETALLESVQAAAQTEKDYIAAVSAVADPAPAKIITGMGPAHSAPSAASTAQTSLREAQTRMENLLSATGAVAAKAVAADVTTAASKLDSLLSGAPAR